METKFLIFILLLGFSCRKDDDPPPTRYKINENIDTIAYEDKSGLVNHPCAVWSSDNKIFTSVSIRYYELYNNLNVIRDSTIRRYDGGQFIEISDDYSSIMYVNTVWSDVSEGGIREMKSNDFSIKEIFDSTNNISSAVYYRDTSHIIYYTYGKPEGTNPGYYLYNKQTKEKLLLLEYINQAGPSEYINGFDVHPVNDIMLIPVVVKGKSTSPLIIEYNFKEKILDTLDITFDLSFNRICLWLRYNRSGDKILYSCYPRGAGGHTTNDDSEVGIIDRNTLTKTILDVNTNNRWTGRSVNICPNWSPDEKHIVYSSAPLSPEGAKGLYGVYIFKNINY